MKKGSGLVDEIVGLYARAATDLPKDVENALAEAGKKEDGRAAAILAIILENIKIARREKLPICQDTGFPVFYVKKPAGASEAGIRDAIVQATKIATVKVPLRENAIDILSRRGGSVGDGFPVVHFEEWNEKGVEIELMLKGGGSENVSGLYSLPDARLSAGRDFDGIEKCVLDCVKKAGGNGCPPYFIGVGVGGSVPECFELAKRQLMWPVGERKGGFSDFEARLLWKVNGLGIGPMGMGGKTTALDVKVATMARHPASYFVCVSLGCWALRRAKVRL
ncbi:MAG: fumarate hydratase [Candidatus Micrarchaeota archaeon]|nr:fumarate hydratase [Candidatus Micrarchaeota archaeon]